MVTKKIALPGSMVSLDGITYYVHGVLHNSLKVKLSPEYKEMIRAALEGLEVICEDGFKSQFDLKNVKIFNEIKFLKIKSRIPYTVLKNWKELISLVFKNNFFDKGLSEIKTLEDLEKIRKLLFKNYPDEPDGMNYIAYMNGDKNFLESKALRIQRYIFEADSSIKYAKSKKLDELHILVGCSHEKPLVYLLQHPNDIDNYKFRKNWIASS